MGASVLATQQGGRKGLRVLAEAVRVHGPVIEGARGWLPALLPDHHDVCRWSQWHVR